MVRMALLERERLLIEKIRFMGEAWYRHRLKVELELGDVRRKLERLASRTERNGARSPDRTRFELRKDSRAKGAPTPPVTRVPEPETKKRQQAPPRSPLGRFHDRLVAMCVVETTAASYSGMRSWKTEPCRVLLRFLAKPVVSTTYGFSVVSPFRTSSFATPLRRRLLLTRTRLGQLFLEITRYRPAVRP
jgi:hypothetical protein